MDDTSTIARIRAACAEDDQPALRAIEEEVDAWQAARDTRLRHPAALAAAAHWYAENGHPVFPCAPGAKHPRIGSAHPDTDPLRGVCKGECGRPGHGFHDATLDPDQITEWWTRWPHANIGLAAGINFDVLDVDGPDGYASLAAVEAEHGPFPHIAYAVTPRGGAHLYMRPTGRSIATGMLPGLDWRGGAPDRTPAGYVLAAPSMSAANGRRYTWTVPLPPA